VRRSARTSPRSSSAPFGAMNHKALPAPITLWVRTLSVSGAPSHHQALGLSASALGAGVGPAARDVGKLEGPADEADGKISAVDAIDPSAVAGIFLDTERLLPEPDVII
jgi:hypothetical protein